MTRRSPKASEGLRSWWRRQRLPRGFGGDLRHGLLCCSCLQPTQKECPPQQNGPEMEYEQNTETVQIIVEDVGMDNRGFNLEEEEGRQRRGRPVGHCSPIKRMRRLTSLSFQQKVHRSGRSTCEKVREEPVPEGAGCLKDAGIDTFLTLPIINLIPPTPSGIIDKGQFFDLNAEEDDGSQSSSIMEMDGMRSIDISDHQSMEEDGGVERGKGLEDEAAEGNREAAEASGKDPSVVAGSMERQGKCKLLWSTFQVPSLPQYPIKSFCTGINLLKFTEQNLDDLNDKIAGSRESQRAELRFLPLSCAMDNRVHVRNAAVRTCSLGNPAPRSHPFHSASKGTENAKGDHRSPRERRITIASYMPQSRDQNGNYSREISNWRGTKPLGELDTDETCQWFSDIGLDRYTPLIREAGLQGSHFASINQGVLDHLELSTVEERERLLSAVYQELYPPDETTRAVDSLLETLGCSDVERFAAALASMTKYPRVSHKSRDEGQHFNIQRSSDLVELTIKGGEHSCTVPTDAPPVQTAQYVPVPSAAPDQTVHLEMPRETTVGNVSDSCLRTLGLQEDRKLFSLKSSEGSSVVFSVDQPLGSLPGSEKEALEPQLSRKKKSEETGSAGSALCVPGTASEGIPANQQRKEIICKMSLQVVSLQNMVQQIHELHQSLVSFYSEMKSMENRLSMADLSLAELEKQLGLTQSQRKETQQKLESLQAQLSVLESKTYRRPEMQLLDKMKLDTQLFKEEIRLIHLGRQVAQLQVAQQQLQTKEFANMKGSTLAGLASLQCPTLLLLVHEPQRETGGYGFTAQYLEGRGLVVVQAQNSHLQPNDRLLEVNGVSVVDSKEEELAALLHPHTSHIVVLRQAPPLPPWDPTQTGLPPLPPCCGVMTS